MGRMGRPKVFNEPPVGLTIMIERSLKRKFLGYVGARGLSMSKILRDYIEQYLEEKERIERDGK